MTSIITGDIINSRKLRDQKLWMNPLKIFFKKFGESPKYWEIYRGDNFQLEISRPEEALITAMKIKAIVKSVKPSNANKRIADIDVRMGIGIGEKDFSAKKISESNGEVFVFSGEKFENLKKEKMTIAVKSPWEKFDEEINLLLKLSLIHMDSWTVSSAELAEVILENPGMTQTQVGKKLKIEQNTVSDRYRRARIDELLAVEKMYRKKLKDLVK